MTFDEFSSVMPRRIEMNANSVNVVCVISYAEELGEFNYAMMYRRRMLDREINTANMLIDVREFSEVNLKSLYNSIDPFFKVDVLDDRI